MTKDVSQPYEFKDTYQFRFTRKIADGGMGSIYEAHLFGSEGFEKTVTIKTIREKFTGDRDFVGRVLEHGASVPYYGVLPWSRFVLMAGLGVACGIATLWVSKAATK